MTTKKNNRRRKNNKSNNMTSVNNKCKNTSNDLKRSISSKKNSDNLVFKNGINSFLYSIKYEYKYIIIYIIISFILTILIFKYGVNIGVKYFSEFKMNDYTIENSDDYVSGYLRPFISFMGTILSVIISFVLLRILSKRCKSYYFELSNMKKTILLIESVIVIFTTCILVYSFSKPEILDLNKYGIDLNNKSNTGQYHLQEVIGISSEGISSPDAPIIYRLIMYLSRIVNHIINNMEVIISIISSLIIPLKVKAELLDIKINNFGK